MNCATVRQLLNEYVENNLTHSASQLLSEHLQQCRQCAAEEDLLRTLAATLRSLPQMRAPLDFTEDVMEKLSQLGGISATEPPVEHDVSLSSQEKAGLLSTLVSASGLRPTWIGVRMMARSVTFTKYVPRPTVKLRIGNARSQSLTKLPLALGFRW